MTTTMCQHVNCRVRNEHERSATDAGPLPVLKIGNTGVLTAVNKYRPPPPPANPFRRPTEIGNARGDGMLRVFFFFFHGVKPGDLRSFYYRFFLRFLVFPPPAPPTITYRSPIDGLLPAPTASFVSRRWSRISRRPRANVSSLGIRSEIIFVNSIR
jgi:hypothetical protein